MVRRQFLQTLTLASAEALPALRKASGTEQGATLSLPVRGFTCVTCAVGLETLLGRTKGVLAVSASYPESRVVIRYLPRLISPGEIVDLIAGMGFQATTDLRS